MNSYEKSKSIKMINGLGVLPKSLKDEIVDTKWSTSKYRQIKGQNLINHVCGVLNIPSVWLNVIESAQLHRNDTLGHTKSKTLGRYWHSENDGKKIEIWNLTAKRK